MFPSAAAKQTLLIMIFIKNPLVFCSASSHERRIVPDEWWETWDEYNGGNTGSCSGREVDSWSKLYKPNTKVFYVLSSGVYFYNEGHGGMGRMCLESERDDYWLRLGRGKTADKRLSRPFALLYWPFRDNTFSNYCFQCNAANYPRLCKAKTASEPIVLKRLSCKLDCFSGNAKPTFVLLREFTYIFKRPPAVKTQIKIFLLAPNFLLQLN